MYVGCEFDPLDPTEDDSFTFNFFRDLSSGETIASVAFELDVMSGTDPTPSARLVGGGAISGTQVSQEISGCQAGVYYRLTATIITNTGFTRARWSHFWCRTPD